MYRAALAGRREHALGGGELRWLDALPEQVLAFRNGDVVVLANTGPDDVGLPAELAGARCCWPASRTSPPACCRATSRCGSGRAEQRVELLEQRPHAPSGAVVSVVVT